MFNRVSALKCRCCGKDAIRFFDGLPIHTLCIGKHWGRHVNGVNASRCLEFKGRYVRPGR